MLVGCAGVTLQCGGGSSSTPNSEAGAAGNGTAGGPAAMAGTANGKAGSAGSSHASGGTAGEEVGHNAGSSSIMAGSGGKDLGSGGVGTAGSAGSTVGGDTGHAGAGGATSAGFGGLETNGGSAGALVSAGSSGAGTSGSGGTSTGGSAGSIEVGGASGVSGSAGVGGFGVAGAAGSGAAGASGSGGTSGAAGASGSGGSGGACSSGAAFHARAPLVFFLLDRSSSMFLPTDYWSPVKASVLATISAYASQIRFGLAAYTGVASQTCPLDLTNAGSIALDNYANINQVLAPLGSSSTKSESPTAAALATLRPTLVAQTGTSKTIFLITDGGHDFCNDGVLVCGSDALVAELQGDFTAGLKTSLFGVKGSPYLDATQTQQHANAGSGVPVVGDSLNTYYMCSSETTWHALWTAKGSPANSALGSYVASGTTNTPYTLLDTTQPDTMTSALKAATAALKSCTYDVTGGQVNQALAAQGIVRVDGVSVPMDASNGWRLNSSTELELVGTACANWRSSTAQTISFEFPCSILNP